MKTVKQKHTNRNTCLVTLWERQCLRPLSTDWHVLASACAQLLLISVQQPPKLRPVSRQYLLRVLPTQWSQKQPEISGDKGSDSQSLPHLVCLPTRVGLGIYNSLYLALKYFS